MEKRFQSVTFRMMTMQEGKPVPLPISIRWQVLGFSPEEEQSVTKNIEAIMPLFQGLKIHEVVEHVAASMRRQFPARDIFVVSGNYMYEWIEPGPLVNGKET